MNRFHIKQINFIMQIICSGILKDKLHLKSTIMEEDSRFFKENYRVFFKKSVLNIIAGNYS